MSPTITRLLIVGGCGYVGHLIQPFMTTDRWMRFRSLEPRGCPEGNCDWDDVTIGDVTDLGDVFLAMRGRHAVIYLAKADEQDPAGLFSIGLHGLYNTLLVAKELGTPRVVIATSLSIYDDWNEVNIDSEDRPGNCSDPYGTVKVLSEKLGAHFAEAHGMSVIALRIAQPKTDDSAGVFRAKGRNPNALPASKLSEAFMAAVKLEGHRGFDVLHLTGDRSPGRRINLDRAKELLGWEP